MSPKFRIPSHPMRFLLVAKDVVAAENLPVL